MTAYEPTSRRPIAGMFRSTARSLVNVAVRAGIHPDVFSYEIGRAPCRERV